MSTDAATELGCAHCGLPVPAALTEPGAASQFCCAGCQAVWAVLHEHGLERYYDLRARADATPARAADRSYAELDDPAFQARACRPGGEGLLATELYLEGVHCSACVWLIERLPRLAPGVVDVRLDLPRARAVVRWDPSAIALSAVARVFHSVGYPPHPCHGMRVEELRRREDRALLARIGIAAAAAGNVMGIDRIHAGTVNLSGRLEARVERAGAETRVGRLMALVEQHARRRAPIAQLADRLSGWFVGAVLALAGVTFALWLVLDPARATSHAVAVLIVSCPCALGLATPLALSAAGRARGPSRPARQGRGRAGGAGASRAHVARQDRDAHDRTARARRLAR